jgi:N-acetylmuramoyl-L-alanine amidase
MNAFCARYPRPAAVIAGLFLLGFAAAHAQDTKAPPARDAVAAPAPNPGAAPAPIPEAAPARDAAAPPAKDAVAAPAPNPEAAPAPNPEAAPAKDTEAAPAKDAAAAPARDTEPTPAKGAAAPPVKEVEMPPAKDAAVAPPKDTRPASSAKCDAAHFRIVLDVGHTAIKYGVASARGVPEFQFNRNLAEVILKHLRDAGFGLTQVKVQEQGDLYSRARDLDSSHPDLILSLHHDGVQDRYLMHGPIDGVVREYSDKFAGYSLFVSYDNPKRESSVRFARLLGTELKSRNHTFTMHHNEPISGENRPVVDGNVGVFRYDHLVVLRSVNSPAVLMESAVIVHPDDELKALNPAFQAEIGDSVVAAVRNYCATQAPPPLPATAKIKSNPRP